MMSISEFGAKAPVRNDLATAAITTPCCCICGAPAFTGDSKTTSEKSRSSYFGRMFKELKPSLVAVNAYACIDHVPALHAEVMKKAREAAAAKAASEAKA